MKEEYARGGSGKENCIYSPILFFLTFTNFLVYLFLVIYAFSLFHHSFLLRISIFRFFLSVVTCFSTSPTYHLPWSANDIKNTAVSQRKLPGTLPPLLKPFGTAKLTGSPLQTTSPLISPLSRRSVMHTSSN